MQCRGVYSIKEGTPSTAMLSLQKKPINFHCIWLNLSAVKALENIMEGFQSLIIFKPLCVEVNFLIKLWIYLNIFIHERFKYNIIE